VLVFDYPGQSEEQNERILAHELAHMLGAWDSAESGSILHRPPGNSFDSSAKQVMELTRLTPLGVGPAVLGRQKEDRITELFARTKSDPSLNPLFRVYLSMGNELWNRGRQEQSLDPLSRAVELSPGDLDARYMLGRADLFMSRFQAAAFDFRKVVEADPRNAAAWNSLGAALLRLNQIEESLAAFRKALELDPSNRTVQSNLGWALVHSPGYSTQGIAQIQAVLRSDPDDAYAQQVLRDALAFQENEAAARVASKNGALPTDKPTLAIPR
jgi:tetratricopeptide (TPR) repeat protein